MSTRLDEPTIPISIAVHAIIAAYRQGAAVVNSPTPSSPREVHDDGLNALAHALSQLNVGSPVRGTSSGSSLGHPRTPHAHRASNSATPRASTSAATPRRNPPVIIPLPTAAQNPTPGISPWSHAAPGNPDQDWYIVTRGKEVGVFQTWSRTQPLTNRVKGSCQHKCKSEAEGVTEFETALRDEDVAILR